MKRTELREIISNRENSGIEFKRDDISPRNLAEEVVAFANFRGGKILLGVEDDGTITGLQRDNPEEWVMQVIRDRIEPPIIPYYEEVKLEEGTVGIIEIVAGPTKPYSMTHHGHRYWYIRVGSTNRECTREEIIRLAQSSGQLNVDLQPVPGASIIDFDKQRMVQYFDKILNQDVPAHEGNWITLLKNMDFLVQLEGKNIPSLGAMLLFGAQPKRLLPQAGIRVLAFHGNEPAGKPLRDQIIKGPIVPLLDETEDDLIENGIIEQALATMRDYVPEQEDVSKGRSRERGDLTTAIREVIVNAIAHRDYSIAGRDITVNMFNNRIEVESPGSLPNTVTIDGLRQGIRYTRNQLLVNVMRDYNYIEHRGQGISRKVIPCMERYNETEPGFEERNNAFIVSLYI